MLGSAAQTPVECICQEKLSFFLAWLTFSDNSNGTHDIDMFFYIDRVNYAQVLSAI